MESELVSTIENMDKTPEPDASLNCFLSDSREELSEILRSRLIECGWRDQVANMCRNLIQKHGVEQIRLEQIIGEVKPKARQSVPDHVKIELLEMIRKRNQAQPQTQQLQQQQKNSIQQDQQTTDSPTDVPVL